MPHLPPADSPRPERLATRGLLWLLRSLPAAAFAYAVLHTAFYLVDTGTLSAVAGELGEIGIWTGWLACLIPVPLALASNDAAVRRMGRRWNALHRWIHPAAVRVVAHWAFVAGGIGAVLAHVLPLVVPQAWRLLRRPRARSDVPA